MLNKNKFYKFLFNYKPMPWKELNEKDMRYDFKKRYVNYALKSGERFYFILKYALKHFSPQTKKILDLGTYPGTMLRILKEFPLGYLFDLYGAGLCITPDFIKFMKEKADATIMTVNLDPQNLQLKNKNYQTRIPLEKESVDFIFALDIVEHLTSPFHMLCEANRVLKKNGKILLTTPNVTRIGSVFKLLAGKSNYDRIAQIDYYDESDEWRPHFHEYSMRELVGILAKVGFQAVEQVFFKYTLLNVKTIKRGLIDFFKIPFYCIPHLREYILVVGRKL